MITPEAARRELQRREAQVKLARQDPLYLVSQMSALDKRTGSRFSLEHLREPLQGHEVSVVEATVRRTEPTWRWQRYLAEKVLSEPRLIVLKGRQIGVTWIVLAVDVAEAILMPGTDSVLFRQKESEAIKNAKRWWILYQSLPAHFKEGIRVLRPDRGVEPGRDGISLQFPDGAISSIVPMSSAKSSGHGESLRRVVLDEAAYIDLLEDIGAAIGPAAGDAAINIISTANGVSTVLNEETEEVAGNEYHRRYWAARDGSSGYFAIFFPFDAHPLRDDEWRETAPEVKELKPHQRAAQYPRNEHEAFAQSKRGWFDAEALEHYGQHVATPLYRCDFVNPETRKLAVGRIAEKRVHEEGFWRVYAEPREGHRYAVGADCATGRGLDFSCAYVCDLSDGSLVAEFHGKLDADLYAAQLHYMAKRYKHDDLLPLLANDNVGIGEAVTVSLRHGREGRGAYSNLYRHVMSSRPSQDISKTFGYPINTRTRPLILNQLEKWVRDRQLPWVTGRLLSEMQTFIERDKDPSPAAQDGSHDDAIFAAAIALEMFRLRGEHPERDARRKSKQVRRKKRKHTWQHAA